MMWVPTSRGVNSMRMDPFAASLVIRAFTLLLLGVSTVATQSDLFKDAPEGGSISKTAGLLAGTRRVDSPSGVNPEFDGIMSIFQGDPKGAGDEKASN